MSITYDRFHDRDGKVEVQLKVGSCLRDDFMEGNAVDGKQFPDAVYHGHSGVVVIWGGRVLSVSAATPQTLPPGLLHKTSWGDPFNPTETTHNGLAR